MFGPRTHRLTKRMMVMLFGLVVLAALAAPHSALAITRVRAGLEIEAGNYDFLGQYGEWVYLPDYGTVWHPYVVADWQPFGHGHWTWTYDGWAWVSYEPFGWLVYHYGNWYYDDSIGWFWVPGSVWSPACVQWYTFGDYCAWAPLPPPGFFWGDPWVPWRHHHFNVWIFVNMRHFGDDVLWRHCAAEPPRRDAYHRDVLVRRAPGIRQVEIATNRQFTPIRIARERVAPSPQAGAPAVRYSRPRPIERQRMVLPDQEVQRVKQYQPQVEREVLVPKENAPRHEMQPQQQQQRQQQRAPVQRGTRGGGGRRR